MYMRGFGLQIMTDISPGQYVPHITGGNCDFTTSELQIFISKFEEKKYILLKFYTIFS